MSLTVFVFVMGFSAGSGSENDYATIKYSNAGMPLWTNRYNNGPIDVYDFAVALVVDSSGNVIVTGNSGGYATIKYSSADAVLWVNRNSDGSAFVSALAVDGSGNVIVTGHSGGTATGLDYTTIKYAPVTTSVEPQPDVPLSGFALQSDPNPFTSASTIRFTIPDTQREHVRLAVYDVHGREVALLVNEALSPGTYERELNGSPLAAGVYWSRLEAGGLSEIRKLTLVR